MHTVVRSYTFLGKNSSSALLIATLYLASVLFTAAFATHAHGGGHDLLVDYRHGKLHIVLAHPDGSYHGDELGHSHDAALSGHAHDHEHESHLTDSVENLASSGKRMNAHAMRAVPVFHSIAPETPAAGLQPQPPPSNKNIVIKSTVVLLI